jgi:hypothetical protein
MKQASMTMLGFTLLLGFTSPAYASPNKHVTAVESTVHWVNPDGSNGIPVMSTVSNRILPWTNPDGTHGIVERHSVLAPAIEYAWANPDGHRSPSMTALSGGDHATSSMMTSKRTDSTPFNDQLLRNEVTTGERPMNTLTFLLGMLVAGVSLLLLQQLWPE